MTETTHNPGDGDQGDGASSAKGSQPGPGTPGQQPGSETPAHECGSGSSKCECPAILTCEMRRQMECWVRMDISSWRAPAFSSYAYLRDELQRLRPCPNVRQSVATGIERALDEALFAMTPPRRRTCGEERPRRQGLRSRLKRHGSGGDIDRRSPRRQTLRSRLQRFYSGSDIEQTWRAIHRAQAALYVIYPRVELVPQAEHVEAVVAELPEPTALLKLVTALISKIAAPPGSTAAHPASPPSTPSSAPIATATAPGTMLRGIYERAMDISDVLQLEARALRNALVTASIAIFLVLVAVGVAHLIEPGIINLCMSVNGHEACPIGATEHPFDVFAVELAGMLGGLLSVVIPLATGERIRPPTGSSTNSSSSRPSPAPRPPSVACSCSPAG